MNTPINEYKHPIAFYTLATIIPWSFWLWAGKLSHLDNPNMVLVSVLGFIGLLSPMVIAFWFMFRNETLKTDFWGRFTNIRDIRPVYFFLTCFLMLGSILLAQAISVAFGYSPDQFTINGQYTFTSGVFPVWFLLIMAPLIEELAWHSYGTDCLRARFSLFTSSIIFAFFWGIWHIPLGSIQGYYQSLLVEAGWIHATNFLVSIFPFVIIMNWLYYKTGRNMVVPIIFHITAGYFNEIFATHPDSKVIQTGLLIVFAIVIVVREKEFFFSKQLKVETA
ncbi:MAG TPA: CPBP family intramembrane metalloprotease [Aliiroseovarius sp.]|nr:CPBP family intramembrane metalloprotease [Aliiroseovarius sp.]